MKSGWVVAGGGCRSKPCRRYVLPQAQSSEYRRAMFLLCTLALMGTEDQLIQAKDDRELWARLGWPKRLELRVRAVRVFCCCLVLSLKPCTRAYFFFPTTTYTVGGNAPRQPTIVRFSSVYGGRSKYSSSTMLLNSINTVVVGFFFACQFDTWCRNL